MAVSSWLTSEVTRECLQNLMSKGYMMTAEFATSLVPAGSVFPASAEEFIVV
jgi:ribulose bisphosphate carboxylase small subunit